MIKSNHANNLKTFAEASEKWRHARNAVCERNKSFRKFDFFSFAVWTNVKQKRASDDETKKNQDHRNMATLSLQLRSYKKLLKFVIIKVEN